MTDTDADWEEVTADRARDSERRYRLAVNPEFAVHLTVTKRATDEACPYHLVLSTVYESGTRHVSDHPVAGYADRESARDGLVTLREVVDEVVAKREDLPDTERRLAHDVIPRFIDAHLDEETESCRPLYDESLHG